MSQQEQQPGITGSTDHPQHRAGEGEGIRAPGADEAGHGEFSRFDGTGNEVVVAVTADEEGRFATGEGASSEEAMAEASTSGMAPLEAEPGELTGSETVGSGRDTGPDLDDRGGIERSGSGPAGLQGDQNTDR